MKKLPYKEGTWFAMPLRQGGYSVGRVTRHIPGEGPIILAYFFGPRREAVPALGELESLTPDAAIKVIRVSDLGLVDGSWTIIGDSPEWRREDWPIPVFIRKDDLGRAAWLVEYADDDPNRVVFEQRVPYDTAGYERDSLSGSGAAEIKVSRILS